MPLSEWDQKLLDQIEHELCADDPKLAAVLVPTGLRSRASRLMTTALAGVVLGMTLVLAGLAAKMIILSVLGFVVVVAAVAHVTTKMSVFWLSGQYRLPVRFPTR